MSTPPSLPQRYHQLSRTIAVFVGLWFLFAVLFFLSVSKVLVFPWQLHWILYDFWELLFLLLSSIIAITWAPRRGSRRLALYSQPAGGAAEADSMDHIEMATHAVDTIGGAGGAGGGEEEEFDELDDAEQKQVDAMAQR